jgi:hypothetical protein
MTAVRMWAPTSFHIASSRLYAKTCRKYLYGVKSLDCPSIPLATQMFSEKLCCARKTGLAMLLCHHCKSLSLHHPTAVQVESNWHESLELKPKKFSLHDEIIVGNFFSPKMCFQPLKRCETSQLLPTTGLRRVSFCALRIENVN